MPVTLTKIVGGQPVDTANGVTVRCPKCLQPYWLSYTDNEWHRVKDWLKIAETAIRKDHDLRHEAATIPLDWALESLISLPR